MKSRIISQLVMMLALAACASSAPVEVAPAPPVQAADQPGASSAIARTLGFLSAATTPDAFATIPPAPQEGDSKNTLDWAVFKQTRALEGSERWALAQNDNSYRPADLLKDFSCSVGAPLTMENAPTLAAILARTTADAGQAAQRAKDIYKRTRPYLHNPGNICIERSAALSASFDYPSGHSSLGWTAGLVMAQIAPDRATQVLERARAYGESRLVCGVHNMSAVEAGRTNAAGVFAALQGSSEYLAAVAKARQEVDTARKSGAKPDAGWCAKEAELVKPLVVK